MNIPHNNNNWSWGPPQLLLGSTTCEIAIGTAGAAINSTAKQ